MTQPQQLDAVVVGAGYAGLHQLHQLRELGLRVRAYDGGDDVGGTWRRHDFPGAHLDTEGYVYQYLFSEQLYRDWGWSERFPAAYEVLRWLRFVADRLDLRRDVTLNTRIVSAHHDDDRGCWRVRTDSGEVVDTRFLISCAGVGDAPTAELGDLAAFAGPVLDTSCWPARDPDLAGLRVGVVGAGSATAQLTPALVDRVGHLTVFADAVGWVLPRANPLYGWQERDAYRDGLAGRRLAVRATASGAEDDPPHAWASSPAGALAALHDDGSRRLWLAGFTDLLTDAGVNREVTAYVADRMRERGAPDPLVPADHGFGTRRPVLEAGYLAAFGRDDVDLVVLGDTPVRRVRPDGVELADGTRRALDVLVLAPEYDAGAPALAGIDVRGRGGRALADDDLARTTLGLAKHGYPNLLATGLPLAPSSAHVTMGTCLQQQTAWITAAVRDLRAAGLTTIEATAASEDAWVAEHAAAAVGSLVHGGTAYLGGVAAYRRHCEREAAAGYPSFSRS